MTVKKWEGTWPASCDGCEERLVDMKYFCDAKDNKGRWGLFCPNCHFILCAGRLGPGYGQKYDSKSLEKIGG